MKKIKQFKIKVFSNKTGKLIPITFNKKFPIKVKRIFFLYGKKDKIRGEHAHKRCSQLFIPIYGKVLLKIKTPDTKKTIYSLCSTFKFNISLFDKVGVLCPT